MDTSNPPVTVTCGKIYTEVSTRLQYVTHKLRIFHADLLEAQSLDIQNILDIRHTTNFEFVMRIESDVKNIDKEFFTDLNSFQVILIVAYSNYIYNYFLILTYRFFWCLDAT